MSKTRLIKPLNKSRRYDKILKENIESVVWVLVERILKIKVIKTELLYPELAFTIEREADFVLMGKSETLFKRHFLQLEVLSGLRNLEQVINKIRQKMPITFDIQKLPSFQEGEHKGEEKALLNVAKRLILRNTPLSEIQEITGLSINELEKLKKELDASKVKSKKEK
jgi:predicted metallo-beta-lactamase superfamily hydrolase